MKKIFIGILFSIKRTTTIFLFTILLLTTFSSLLIFYIGGDSIATILFSKIDVQFSKISTKISPQYLSITSEDVFYKHTKIANKASLQVFIPTLFSGHIDIMNLNLETDSISNNSLHSIKTFISSIETNAPSSKFFNQLIIRNYKIILNGQLNKRSFKLFVNSDEPLSFFNKDNLPLTVSGKFSFLLSHNNLSISGDAEKGVSTPLKISMRNNFLKSTIFLIDFNKIFLTASVSNISKLPDSMLNSSLLKFQKKDGSAYFQLLYNLDNSLIEHVFFTFENSSPMKSIISSSSISLSHFQPNNKEFLIDYAYFDTRVKTISFINQNFKLGKSIYSEDKQSSLTINNEQIFISSKNNKIHLPEFGAEADIDLSFLYFFSNQTPELRLTINSGSFLLSNQSKKIISSLLSEEQSAFSYALEKKIKKEPSPTQLNVSVLIPKPVFVKTDEAEFFLTGKIEAFFSKKTTFNLKTNITKGKYFLRGRTITIESSRVSIKDSSSFNPTLDINLSHQLKDKKLLVFAKISGLLNSPHFELYSIPKKEPHELALIFLGEEDIGKIIKEVDSKNNSSELLKIRDILLEDVHLDFTKMDFFNRDMNSFDSSGYQVRVSKQIHKNVFIEYNENSISEREISLKYKLSDHLSLELQHNDEPFISHDALFFTIEN